MPIQLRLLGHARSLRMNPASVALPLVVTLFVITITNSLLPLLQRRRQRIRHAAAAASGRNPRRRQPAAVGSGIGAGAAHGSRAAVADLGAVDFLEGADAAGLLDAVEHSRAGGVAGRRGQGSRHARRVARVAVRGWRRGRGGDAGAWGWRWRGWWDS